MIAEGIACANCCYWRQREEYMGGSPHGETASVTTETAPVGQCRRFPPFMTMVPGKGPRAQWPLTLPIHWCGEHGVIERKDP